MNKLKFAFCLPAALALALSNSQVAFAETATTKLAVPSASSETTGHVLPDIINEDQKPGAPFPIPMDLNYEITVTIPNDEQSETNNTVVDETVPGNTLPDTDPTADPEPDAEVDPEPEEEAASPSLETMPSEEIVAQETTPSETVPATDESTSENEPASAKPETAVEQAPLAEKTDEPVATPAVATATAATTVQVSDAAATPKTGDATQLSAIAGMLAAGAGLAGCGWTLNRKQR